MLETAQLATTPAIVTPGPAADAWRLCLRGIEQTYDTEVPLQVQGKMPSELRGTLYRNGPGAFAVQGTPLKSLFDGDGLVQAIRLGDGSAGYTSRFVQTKCRQMETQAGRMLFGGIGHRPPWGFLDVLRKRQVRQTANTNIVHHHGHLYALNEGDWPYRMDPKTLETLGRDPLGGMLTEGLGYSAHPRVHPRTGVLWNIGMEYVPSLGRRGLNLTCQVHLYATQPDGRHERVGTYPLPFAAAMVHDMAITERHAVFVLSPLVIARPMAMAVGRIAAGDALQWQPELGCRVALIELDTGIIHWQRAPAALTFHMVNAWDQGDGVILDACTFGDGAAADIIRDIVEGRDPQVTQSQLIRMEVSPSTYAQRQLSATPLDFPRVAPHVQGRPHTLIYGTTWDAHSPFPDVPVCLDAQDGTALTRPLSRPGEYASEGVLVAKTGAQCERDVYILSLIMRAKTAQLRIYDGAEPSAPAIAQIDLPGPIPLGFHGNWLPA